MKEERGLCGVKKERRNLFENRMWAWKIAILHIKHHRKPIILYTDLKIMISTSCNKGVKSE